MRAFSLALACSLVLGAAGCRSLVPNATLEDIQWARGRWADATPGQIDEGRTLFINKCGGCHRLHAPSAVSHARWAEVVRTMAPRTRLFDREADLITRYLLAVTRPAGESPGDGASGAMATP